MTLEERLKEAQARRQELVSKANELRQQAQQLAQQSDQCLLEAKELDGEIKAYTLLIDEKNGDKPKK